MQIPFDTPVRKRLVIGVALVLAAAYVTLAATLFLAAWVGGRAELTSLQRAARLDPGKADYRNHLGRYYELVARDPAAAIAPYTAAVRLNPHSARYWFDLASAYQVRGDIPNQTSALEHAIAADPTTPDVAWEAANLYLVRGENEKALREFRVVMANDTSLVNAAALFSWRIEPDIDALLRDVIPPRTDAYIAFLDLLMSKQETAATKKVWDALVQSREPFERRRVSDYFTYLIRHKEIDEAVLVWRQAADRFGLNAYLPSSTNLVVNPNFSLDILNSGFDWQHQKQAGVDLSLDPRDFHGGRRSLLVTFDGPRVEDAGIYQYIPVQPNTAYDFSAYYKSADLQGAGGPHLTITDMYNPKVIYYDSDEMKETGFWKSVGGELNTGADCKLVVLHIRRIPPGSPIRGKLWVDDFHLARK
jgi:tetratricopeptide (TPR) repeat protein